MNKRILTKIAKEWSKAILLANDTSSFDHDSLLSLEEQNYVVEQVHKLAEKISDQPYSSNLESIIAKYYEEAT